MKTFTNDKYGYSLKYSNDWNLGGSGPGQTPEFIAQHFWVDLQRCQQQCQQQCGSMIIQVNPIDQQLDDVSLNLSAKEIWLRDISKSRQIVIKKEEQIYLGGMGVTKIIYLNKNKEDPEGKFSKVALPIPMKTIVVVHNKRLYQIDLRELTNVGITTTEFENINFSDWVYEPSFNQIISTFKFTQ